MTGLSHLRNTTCQVMPPQRIDPPGGDLDQLRLTIGQRFRTDGKPPIHLRNPFTGQLVWVEGEPDDWRDRLNNASADELAAISKIAKERINIANLH